MKWTVDVYSFRLYKLLLFSFGFNQGLERDFNLITIKMSVVQGKNQSNMLETEQEKRSI